jgi:hypothetical protein
MRVETLLTAPQPTSGNVAGRYFIDTTLEKSTDAHENMKTSLALRRAGRSELIELSLVNVTIGALASD